MCSIKINIIVVYFIILNMCSIKINIIVVYFIILYMCSIKINIIVAYFIILNARLVTGQYCKWKALVSCFFAVYGQSGFSVLQLLTIVQISSLKWSRSQCMHGSVWNVLNKQQIIKKQVFMFYNASCWVFHFRWYLTAF